MFHRLLGALPTAVFVGGLTMAAWAAARNLVANPSFEKVEKAKVGEPREVPTEWRFYVIVMPAADRADTSTAHTGKTSFHFSLGEKAKAFLHSAAFPVTTGTKYRVRVWAKGQGSLGLEMLWWKRYPENIAMCEHHRDAKEPVKAAADWKVIEATFTAPEEATKAYLRLVGVNGDLWVDDVEVTAQS